MTNQRDMKKMVQGYFVAAFIAFGLCLSGCGHIGMHIYKASWESEMNRQYAPMKRGSTADEAQRAERFAAADPGKMLRVRIRGGTVHIGSPVRFEPLEVYLSRGETRQILVFQKGFPYQTAVEMRFSGDGRTFVFDTASDRPLTIPVGTAGVGSRVVSSHANNNASPQGVSFELATDEDLE